MLLGTLGASLLGNILAGKGINRAGEGAIGETRSRIVMETKSLLCKQVRKTTTKHKNF